MGQNTKRPTLKTIAELTGLAVPTISRALNGSEEIGAETRARVRKVANEIGYVPNRAGVRLRTGRSYVIGLMLSAESEGLNFTTRFINAIAAGLRGTRYNLTINPYFPDEDPLKAVRRIVETHAADALILNRTRTDDPRVEFLMERGFPFATYGRTSWAGQHDYYDFDNQAMAEIGVNALAERGRKSLLLIAPPAHQNYAQDMIRGFQVRSETLGLKHQVATDISCEDDGALIREKVVTLRQSGFEFDGIVCGSALCCLEALVGLESAGLTVGKEFDVFSKEAGSLLNRFRPEVLTIHEDPSRAGRRLAQAVLDRIERPSAPLTQHLERPTAM